MRGINITNIYIIDYKEYTYNQLTQRQIIYINSIKNLDKYNQLRNKILDLKGDEFKCVIKIEFPTQKTRVFDNLGLELFNFEL